MRHKDSPGHRFSIFTPGKKVYTACFPEYRLTDSEIGKLQGCLLEMFLVIREICNRNGIRYMMAGGSLLGTVRHQGFIPWDDDLDLMITREDYIRFRKAFARAKREGICRDYILAEPGRSRDYYFKIPKIYKKDTNYSQLCYMGNSRYNMVGIDLFIIEYMPGSRLKRAVNTAVFDFAYYASSFCLDYICPSPVILKKGRTDPQLRRYYRARRVMGAVFSVLGGMQFYLKVCRKISEYPHRSTLMGIPCGISYSRIIFDASFFSETTTGMFCGYEVTILRRYHEYLTHVFGDYMTIPPEEEREVHVGVTGFH